MWWIAIAILQSILVVHGIRGEQRAGLWSWSKFAFALYFAALESVIVVAPIFLIELKDRNFWPVAGAAWTLAAANFIWFIIVCRRWRLPDGRTSLQASHDENLEGSVKSRSAAVERDLGGISQKPD